LNAPLKYLLGIALFLIVVNNAQAQSNDVVRKRNFKSNFSFGRSQHIQYLNNNSRHKTFTLLNKAYFLNFSPYSYKNLKPFISLNYEYFITQAACYTCVEANFNEVGKKYIHFINFATIGAGFTKELSLKNKKGRALVFVFGASIERYLFKKSLIFNKNAEILGYKPFNSSNKFYNQYFFKDLYGIRILNNKDMQLFFQISGLILRNERLNYAPSKHVFHNFMMGFHIFLK
jgi:hypothetical protein